MPAPTNKYEVRQLLGVVTYLSRFSEDLPAKSEPLRTLLKKETVFIWEANERKAFEEIKTLISYAPLLKYFNPVETVEIHVDASSSGLGACLMQGNEPVRFASRALTETYGRKVTIYNDHKPTCCCIEEIYCRYSCEIPANALQSHGIRLRI